MEREVLTVKEALVLLTKLIYSQDKHSRKCCFKSTDQSEQADLQEFLQSLRQVHSCSDCDEADIEEWIQLDYDDQGYWLLNDEQIIAAVTQNENDNNSDEDDNKETESTIPQCSFPWWNPHNVS